MKKRVKTLALAIFLCLTVLSPSFAQPPQAWDVAKAKATVSYKYTIPRDPNVRGIEFRATGLPAGLTMSLDGVISGKPAGPSPGTVFTVTVSGASLGDNTFSQDYKMVVEAVTNPLLHVANPVEDGPAAPANPLLPPQSSVPQAAAPAPEAAPVPAPVAAPPPSLPQAVIHEPVKENDATFDIGLPAGTTVPAGATVSFTRGGKPDKLNNGSGPVDSVPATFTLTEGMTLTPNAPIGYCDAIGVTIAASGFLPSNSVLAYAVPKPAIVQPPSATKVTASLWLPKTLTNVMLSVLVNGHLVYVKDGDNAVGAIGVTKSPTDITLAAPLQPGDSVVVRYQDSPCALMRDSDAVTFGTVPVPTFRDKLAPTQTALWITVPVAPPGTGTLRVRVNSTIAGLSDGNGGTASSIQTAFANLQTAATLASQLAAGDVVTCEFQLGNVSKFCDPVTVVDPGDLGKVRYYFTSGIVLSNSQNFQFQSTGTQAGLFLGLDVDRSWLSVQPHGLRRIGFNSYFDSRLTSVPTQGVQAGSGVTPTDTFLQSQKAASLQAGIYLPIMTNDWTPRDTPYAFSISPMAKTGFTTLTDATNATTPSPAQTGRFFTFYSYGTRLGIYRIRKDSKGDWERNSSPESIGYFDVTMGKFGNFQAFRDLSAQTGVLANTQFQTIRPWRYQFEGIIKIPPVFVIGFSANIGQGAPGPVCATKISLAQGMTCSTANGGTLYPFLPPRDDLRFMFGAQFDIRQLFKKIPSF